MTKSGIIYVATGPNGKKYVGKTVKSLHRRKIEHLSNAFNKNASNYNCYFYRAIRKYGAKSFKWGIVYFDVPEYKLSGFEKDAIIRFSSMKFGYNLTEGGEGSSGFRHTEESKKKMSKSTMGQIVSDKTRKKLSEMRKGKKKTKEHIEKIRKSNIGKLEGKKHPNYGKHLSEETKRKISKNRKGRCCRKDHPNFGKYRSEDTKKKISVANTGRSPSEKTILAVKKANTGRIPSIETKMKISKALTGKCLSEETKQKISKSRLGIKLRDSTKNKLSEINSKNNPEFIIRKDGINIGIWRSVSKCAKDLKISKTTLRRYLFGEYTGRKFRGYSFEVL